MKSNIVIVDDFLENPWELRQQALKAEYPIPEQSTYPGRNSSTNFYTKEMHDKIQNRWGEFLEPAQGSACGFVRISLEKDTFEQDIHIDPGWDVGGVLFLNSPQQCFPDAGTSFWYHNKLGMERCPSNPIEGKMYGFHDYDHIRKEIIYGDGLDRSKWTRYALTPMKFNRLVLFDPMLWHSHGENFGDTLENGRLVMLFFLTVKK